MTRSARLAPFVTPFVVTLAGLGLPYLWLMLNGFCMDDTSCAAASYFAGPLLLVVAIITGYVAGRLSSSNRRGLVGVGAAAFALPTSFYVALELMRGLSSPGSGGAAFVAEWEFAARAWLGFTGLAFVVMMPGFLVGRERRKASERKRALERVSGEVASLAAWRDAGSIGAEDFERQKAALLGSVQAPDQAPPNHRCGRCGKSLSPAWRAKCKHCGALYADFPPVAR